MRWTLVCCTNQTIDDIKGLELRGRGGGSVCLSVLLPSTPVDAIETVHIKERGRMNEAHRETYI